ncbi:MAG: TIGR00296 family protein [Candidatus Bathyarchaeia archaeon]
MNLDLTLEEGEYLVKLARRAIETRLKTGEAIRPSSASEKLTRRCGVFVTLNRVEDGAHILRGCIGFPYPVMPLAEAVVEAALGAAFEDPRFHPVSSDEMGHIAVEVSVLTPPETIKVEDPSEYPGKIVIGRDGLMVGRGVRRGLLLPQVAVEWGWDAEEFLTNCCLKAGLPPDAWLDKRTEVSRFQAIIFAEERPGGAVKKVSLSP